MAAITMKNIVKQYGDGFPAVNDVSLDIADGEFMILVGPSGCGKSTLLRMIVGLEDITSGDMLIGDERVNEKAPRDRNLSMVFQNYALYPHLTVFENIAFPLRLHKVSDTQVKERVQKAAALLELTEHLDRKPANLSGGQRQRVAMGRAIVREAQAFLFDEPLSNLDAKLRGQMRTEISRLQKRLGITTVYVTHDQVEAMTLGDRVAVLRKGVLQQVASPRTLYEEPVNLFVAGFIGSPPMNFIPAAVADGELRTPFGPMRLPQTRSVDLSGREMVLVGARPEAFEDAAVVSDTVRDHGMTFDANVDVIEWLGNEQYAYVPYEAPDDIRKRLAELERELDSEAMRTQLVVSLDATSRLAEGSAAPLWLDLRTVHIFDPASGDNLTVSPTRGVEAPARQSGQSTADRGSEAGASDEDSRPQTPQAGAGEGTASG
ncbi:ABC transporter ATP-binding protein [Phytoactinopolyspora limicola]|uniref:ABC transporter ATP-binding protein n=1 Tax=Phytoactinopolyspora limicola TaxID=2715536 RepID=UPI00140C28C2|nr:sn-glycerol-3-phosphate ABC transporter ATP-binding protein UgpC [Phytoactinopolyspora limicola]